MENVDKLADKLSSMSDAFTTAALEAARMEAVAELASFPVQCGVLVALYFAFKYAHRKSKETRSDFDFPGYTVLTWVIGIFAFFLAIDTVWVVTDPRTWVTLAHPEYWLAKKLLGL